MAQPQAEPSAIVPCRLWRDKGISRLHIGLVGHASVPCFMSKIIGVARKQTYGGWAG
jgi:hypothetical protein